MRQGLRQGRRGQRQSLPLRWLLYLLLLLLSLGQRGLLLRLLLRLWQG